MPVSDRSKQQPGRFVPARLRRAEGNQPTASDDETLVRFQTTTGTLLPPFMVNTINNRASSLNMPTIRVDPFDPDPEVIEQAVGLLRRRRLVAFPTETVYGLGANALDAAAVGRIFSAKGRPKYNPLIVHVPDTEAAHRLAQEWPESAERLAEAFWPGPLTLVLPKQPAVPNAVTAGLPSVALRVPAHPVAQALLRAAALPVAAPSANRSSEISPTTAQHVRKSLGDAVDLILDGGPTTLGIESTVVDLSGAQPVLLRPGVLPVEEIESIAGTRFSPAKASAATAARPSPGMLDRHYAPQAALKLFASDEKQRAAHLARQAVEERRLVGGLLISSLEASVQHPIAMPSEPRAYARLLYAALHSLDDLGCHLILAETPPETSAWSAILDRLRRAAR